MLREDWRDSGGGAGEDEAIAEVGREMEATLWTEPVREGRVGARLAVHISWKEGEVGKWMSN